MAKEDLAGKPPTVGLQLEGLERAWVRRALEVLRGTLIRSRGKELAGSEVYEMRTREIAQLNALLEKVG